MAVRIITLSQGYNTTQFLLLFIQYELSNIPVYAEERVQRNKNIRASNLYKLIFQRGEKNQYV